jgi:hypothetical protein
VSEIVSSRLRYLKDGKAFKNLLLSKYTFAMAVDAVSLVIRGLPYPSLLLMACSLHTNPAMKGLTFFEGGFLLKHDAILLKMLR